MDKIDMLYIDKRCEKRGGDTLVIEATLNLYWSNDGNLTLCSFGSKAEAERTLGKILKAISY
jgi:hypothetical protein